MSFRELLKTEEGKDESKKEDKKTLPSKPKKAKKHVVRYDDGLNLEAKQEPLLEQETFEGSRQQVIGPKRSGDDISGKDFIIKSWKDPTRIKVKIPPEKMLAIWKPSNASIALQRQLDEEQIKWQNNVVDNEFLTQATPNVVESQNPLGLRRYIFVSALKANKNGLLYYIVPLLANLFLLFLNVAQVAFFENFIFSLATLICGIGLLKSAKSKTFETVKKLAFIVIFTGFYVLFIEMLRQFPERFEKIYPPFALKLILILTGIYYFVKFYGMVLYSYAQDCNADFGNVVQIYAGPPRVGKTSQMVQDGYVIALMKWRKLQYDFFLWHSREEEILSRNKKEELLEYHEIKIAYTFYIMCACIPCLWSNIPVQDKCGKRAHELTTNHLKGVERLPIYSVVLIDEIGAVLKAELSVGKDRPYDVSDMFRLGGHFLKWCVIGCEQDYNNVYIDCRRVVGQNKVFLTQEWVCRPLFLIFLYNILELFLTEKFDKKIIRKPKSAKILKTIKDFITSIGFRRKIYTVIGNTQTSELSNTKTESGEVLTISTKRFIRYIPANIVADYDDRSYRECYPSYFDKSISGRLHKSLRIDGSDFEYSRQYVSTTKTVERKRESVDSNVENLSTKKDSADDLLSLLNVLNGLKNNENETKKIA